MTAQQLCEIGAIEEVDVGGYDFVNVKCRPGKNKDETFGDTSKKRYYCCGVCFMEFVTRTSFHEHLSVEHDVHPQIHELTFDTMDEFKRFVRWLELKGGAHFRHKSGSKRRQRGKGIFMACNRFVCYFYLLSVICYPGLILRSGFVNSSNATGSERDRVGPYRMGHTCTAYIHGTQHADGRVSIEMCGDHYGHDVRMRLPPIIKSIIAQKQMEGESNADIIDYLKQHFLPYANENIYAQRACLIDNEELRTINVTVTKKWEIEGIPTTCEIWEEELLDLVGIIREGVPRVRPLNEKTTEEIAEEQNWPRPNVFMAKVRLKTGDFVPYEMVLETEREIRESQENFEEIATCVSPGNTEELNEIHPSLIDMVPPVKRPTLSHTLNHNECSPGRSSMNILMSVVWAMLGFNRHPLQFKISPHSIPQITLSSLLLRLKALRPMISHVSLDRVNVHAYSSQRGPSMFNHILLIFRALNIHYIGNMCQRENESSNQSEFDTSYDRVFRQSRRCLKDDSYLVLSDDEDIALATGGAFEYSSYIWRLFLRNSPVSFSMYRHISMSPVIRDSIRDAHRAGTKITGPVKVCAVYRYEIMEGTTGAGVLSTVSLHAAESRLPTAETLKMKFDGILYSELPIVYIKATKNNTLVTVMDKNNNAIIYTSCRLEGFKHARKKTTIAGQTTGVAAGQRLLRRGIRTVRVQVKGLGPGRMTCVKGLAVAGVNVVSITDHTPLKELGPRPRKIRRV
ncbi:ribosomal protein S11 [Dictyocaulus viviparus]|uniref:Ribosomal protein S11 n=1 Tax=Dictyocaulus viviparus TaxID=29172 RepID=A0A0D8XXU9_DICVI|nr:ribosomal protein S11 [Dictyocaulus viviparus]